jgi:hypothetical protein
MQGECKAVYRDRLKVLVRGSLTSITFEYLNG